MTLIGYLTLHNTKVCGEVAQKVEETRRKSVSNGNICLGKLV